MMDVSSAKSAFLIILKGLDKIIDVNQEQKGTENWPLGISRNNFGNITPIPILNYILWSAWKIVIHYIIYGAWESITTQFY